MQWKHYHDWRNVVQRYQVLLEGWPENIPFLSLSDCSNTLANLDLLLRNLQNGKIYWWKLSVAKLAELNKERDDQLENGEIAAPAPRRPRSDRGKKHSQSKATAIDNGDDQEPRRKAKRKRISRRVVSDNDDDNDNDDNDDNDRSHGENDEA
jgi:hypothetical protein